MDVFALIEDAMKDLNIESCDFCGGEGEVGLPTLRGACPQCGGRGVVVTNELEVDDGGD